MENKTKYWLKLCKLKPYSFMLVNGGVSCVEDRGGSWLERHKVQELVESADSEIQELRSALQAMITYFGMDEDEWSKPVFDKANYALNGD